MRLWKTLIFLSFFGVLQFQHAHARRSDLVPGSRYTSARGAALGDAFIPLANDGGGSLFYNPAGLGKIRTTTLEALNLQLQANSDYVSRVNGRFYQVTSLSQYASTVNRFQGYAPGVSGGLLPAFFFRGFAFGLLAQGSVSASRVTPGTITYRSRYHLIPTVGTGVRLASGVLRLGYSFQWVNMAAGERTVASDSGVGYNDRIAQGSAFSHNVGLALTLPYIYLPALNIVARNVGGAKYKDYTLYGMANNPSGRPPDEEMSVDAALSYESRTGGGGNFNTVLQLRDATDTSGVGLTRRLALGLEFTFRDTFFLRGGWGSMTPHAGIGLKQKGGEISLAWFAENVGSPGNLQLDRRFMFQYQLRAF